IEAEPERVQQLQRQAQFFLEGVRQRGLRSPAHPGAAVIPVLVGDSEPCIRLAAKLFERGINVVPMIAPAVEPQGARLRFFLSCAHTKEQLNYTLDTLAQEMANLSLL
ncbi:MAG TPA: 8-amino-7-oxononanoate synthase, partial [Cyanobacteria bacterium UBA8543]|nr:8-amino-7-oxononanoate synthase [Cyanobacteria bacterium UBA8543]